MPNRAQSYARALWLLPLAALFAILPLVLHGCSCGQDISFHIQSWLEASTQLRHGHYPHWAFTPARNAGEPRFIFYPPLSWLLGALLTTIFPIAACPTIFIAIALLASGLTFYKLASHFTGSNAALLAAALYLANPYMLFNAFERSALAELLAAAWIPLLLLFLLHERPTVRGIAIPLALLWLTNAPAAVMGSYLLAAVATLRVLQALHTSLSSRPEPERSAGAAERLLYSSQIAANPLRLTLTYLAGTILGLALPAFYLIPAAYERKYVQVSMAILPNMRYQDNFLFTRTTDAAHNAVNHTASTLALTLLILTAATLLTLFFRARQFRAHEIAPAKQFGISTEHSITSLRRSVILSEVSRGILRETQSKDPETTRHAHTANSFSSTSLILLLATLTLLIAFLLTPLSTHLWQHLPDLAFLQFPWRLLTLLTPILALAVALLFDAFAQPCTTQLSPSAQNMDVLDPDYETWVRRVPAALSLILPLALSLYTYHLYAQACDPTDDPATISHLLATHHGTLPTDEYTPTAADNDVLRTDNPGYWLARFHNDPAPNTLPTPAELNPNLNTDDNPIPDAQTLSTPAPHHLTLNTTTPSYLIFNLRDYPNWIVTDTDDSFLSTDHPPHIPRADGLIAIRVAAGHSRIDITWRRTPDQTIGLAISILALIVLAFTYIKPRTPPFSPSAQNSVQDAA